MARPDQPLPAAPGPVDTRLAVVLTCHGAYLGLLPDAVASIDAQQPAATQKIVVFDGCDPPADLAERGDWTVVRGDWGSPNPARNLGLRYVWTAFVVFFDADNAMPPGTLAGYAELVAGDAHRPVACWYPDLQYVDRDLRPTTLRSMGEADYWRLRRENYIDTSACWRVSALRGAGGWDETVPNSDDYTLALHLTRQGWELQHAVGVRVLMREHELGRRSAPLWAQPGWYAATRWQVRRHAVVTLLRGDMTHTRRWLRWLRDAELPPQTHLVAVDNSHNPAFGRYLRQRLPLLDRYDVSILRHPARLSPGAARIEVLRHVGRLYNDVLAEVDADLVLTVEDDVEPPLDAARRLYDVVHSPTEQWRGVQRIGVVGAVYENPDRRGTACLSHGTDLWGESPALDQVAPTPQRVGFIGAGCTWYAGWALRDVLPAALDEAAYLGWDAVVCREARRHGWEVWADGRVVARHWLEGRR